MGGKRTRHAGDGRAQHKRRPSRILVVEVNTTASDSPPPGQRNTFCESTNGGAAPAQSVLVGTVRVQNLRVDRAKGYGLYREPASVRWDASLGMWGSVVYRLRPLDSAEIDGPAPGASDWGECDRCSNCGTF